MDPEAVGTNPEAVGTDLELAFTNSEAACTNPEATGTNIEAIGVYPEVKRGSRGLALSVRSVEARGVRRRGRVGAATWRHPIGHGGRGDRRASGRRAASGASGGVCRRGRHMAGSRWPVSATRHVMRRDASLRHVDPGGPGGAT